MSYAADSATDKTATSPAEKQVKAGGRSVAYTSCGSSSQVIETLYSDANCQSALMNTPVNLFTCYDAKGVDNVDVYETMTCISK